MRLADLDGAFFKLEPAPEGGSLIVRLPDAKGAVGVAFDDPCGDGSLILIYFENPVDAAPDVRANLRWNRSGETIETLSLTPSIFINPRATPPGSHFYITDGAIRMC